METEIEETPNNEIVERLEASEKTVSELKEMLAKSLELVNQLNDKQRQMQKAADLRDGTVIDMASTIGKYITLDTKKVAKAVVENKILSGQLDGLMDAIKEDIENTLNELQNGKVTDELVAKVAEKADSATIAAILAEDICASDVASNIPCEDIAYHIDTEYVAQHICSSEVASNIDHSDVAGYLDTEYVADYINLNNLSNHISTDEIADNMDLETLATKINMEELAASVDISALAKSIAELTHLEED